MLYRTRLPRLAKRGSKGLSCVSWKLSRTVLRERDRSNPVLSPGTFLLVGTMPESHVTLQLRPLARSKTHRLDPFISGIGLCVLGGCSNSSLTVNSGDSASEKLGTSTAADPPGSPETRPLPESKPGEMKVQMEAPLVFSGKERAQARAPAAPVLQAAALPLSAKDARPLPAVVVLPPEAKPARKGFFGKVKGFFGAIFR